jgi:peptidoglycan/LPS O-acetylase OafA/YrhL
VLLIGPWFLLFQTTGVVVTIGAVVSEVYLARTGYSVPGNLWIVLCGLAGMTAGITIWPVFMKTIRAASLQRVITTGVLLTAVITYYVVSLRSDVNRYDLPVYLWGVASIIAVLYLSYGALCSVPTVGSWLQLLGRYSLISYLVQMILIRLALSVQSSYFAVAVSYWVIFLVVLSAVGLTVASLDKELRKNRALLKSYTLIFG